MKECRLVMTNELEGLKVKSPYYITNYLNTCSLDNCQTSTCITSTDMLVKGHQNRIGSLRNKWKFRKTSTSTKWNPILCPKRVLFLIVLIIEFIDWFLINHSLLSVLLMVFRPLSLSTLTSYRPDKMPLSQWWVSVDTTLRMP